MNYSAVQGIQLLGIVEIILIVFGIIVNFFCMCLAGSFIKQKCIEQPESRSLS